MRDEDIYTEPTEFSPDRFLKPSVHGDDYDPKNVIFGFGRRCVTMGIIVERRLPYDFTGFAQDVSLRNLRCGCPSLVYLPCSIYCPPSTRTVVKCCHPLSLRPERRCKLRRWHVTATIGLTGTWIQPTDRIRLSICSTERKGRVASSPRNGLDHSGLRGCVVL